MDVHPSHSLPHSLKPEHVILDPCPASPCGWVARVDGYGLAVKLPLTGVVSGAVTAGTPTHMAPEVKAHRKLFQSSDAYSFGVLLWWVHFYLLAPSSC